VTAQPGAHVRFRRAIERRALWMAEDAARELSNLSLEDALELVHLYAERGSEVRGGGSAVAPALPRENAPKLETLADVVTSLAKRVP
jgi:hypothetical protein